MADELALYNMQRLPGDFRSELVEEERAKDLYKTAMTGAAKIAKRTNHLNYQP